MEKKRTLKSVEHTIAAFFRENRRMPTYAEMMRLLGVRSKATSPPGFPLPPRKNCGMSSRWTNT
jgi:hypothetical protein